MLKDWRRPGNAAWLGALVSCALALGGCDRFEPIDAKRYLAPDHLYTQLRASVDTSPELTYVADIDHSRLAADQAVAMPPSHLLLASSPRLETAMVALDPLLALELPLRALAYESVDGTAMVTYNRWSDISARHDLAHHPELGQSYDAAMAAMVQRIPRESIRHLQTNDLDSSGIITLVSAHDFDTTVARVRAAIDAAGDTTWFGDLDLRAQAAELGIPVRPLRLLLFGAPEPGGRAMASAPALGLDAFCQKILVWQAEDGGTRISLNDLPVLAERQGIPNNLPLRIISFRMKSTFQAAADPQH